MMYFLSIKIVFNFYLIIIKFFSCVYCKYKIYYTFMAYLHCIISDVSSFML